MIKKRKVALSVLAGVVLGLAGLSPALATDFDILPTHQLAGPSTALTNPCYIEKDASGNLYVSDTNNATVTVYAPGATGDTAPIRTLTGGNTQITNPYGMALDSSGRLYVVDGLTNKILVFAAGASGNVAPIHTISVGAQAYDLEWSPVNGDLIVSEYGQIESFTNPLTATTPSHTITTGSGHALGLALDSTGGMYVSDTYSSRILYFASFGSQAADRTISGSNTGLNRPWDLEVDRSSGILLVANSEGTRAALFFSETANGDVAPDDTIKGTGPALLQPAGLLQTSDNELLLMDRANAALKTFSLSGIVPVSQSGNSGGSSNSSGGQNSGAGQSASDSRSLANTGFSATNYLFTGLLAVGLGLVVLEVWRRRKASSRQ